MKSTALLVEDHQKIARAVAIIEKLAEKAEAGELLPDRDVEDVVQFLEMFADSHHQGKEEAVLFPALYRCCPEDYDKFREISFEHDQERSLVDGLQDSMRTHKAREFAYYAARLVQILRAHMTREEEGLFALVDRVLSPAEDERVAQELIGFQRAWEEKEVPPMLARLAELEKKYLKGE
jgi:hemerythrin-like domain-containing protein